MRSAMPAGRQGFTLVELMVAITITLVLAGTGMVSINKFLAKEKINQAATEVVSLLNLTRNLAMTGQAPSGFNLQYVSVTLINGTLIAYPTNSGGVGTKYFSKKVAENGVSLTQINLGGLQFATGSGKLLDATGSPLPSGQIVGLSVTSAEVSDSRQITISPFGAVTLLPAQ